MSGVDTCHPDYELHKENWQIVRDCIDGEAAVKHRTTEYLPHPDASSAEASSRYNRYIQRAVFYNATGRTFHALLGAIFRKETTIALPSAMSWANEDIDGAGTSAIQAMRKVTCELLKAGRCGMLVDFPALDSAVLASEIQQKHPTLNVYTAESIISWRTEERSHKEVLTQIVLKESYEAQKSEFEFETKYRYRVLSLEENAYVQKLYIDDEPVEIIEPRNKDGRALDYIPFVFFGTDANTPGVQKAPLLDIARLNLSHYRTSADLEELLFLVGQSMLVMNGLNQNWIEDNLKGKVKVGSMSPIFLPEGGSASYIQPSSDQILASQLKEKELQMQTLGARLMTQSSGEAAETVRMRQSGEAAVLESIAKNVGDGFVQALIMSTDMSDANADEIEIVLNTDFFSDRADPQYIMSLVNLHESGAISMQQLRQELRAKEVVTDMKTDEEIDEEIEAEGIVA